MSGFGEEVLRHVPATSAMLEELVNKTERLYVLTKNPVQDEGYVANLELNVLQAGPMYVQVSDTKKSFLYSLRLLNLLRFPKLFSANQWTETKPDPEPIFQSRCPDSITNELSW